LLVLSPFPPPTPPSPTSRSSRRSFPSRPCTISSRGRPASTPPVGSLHRNCYTFHPPPPLLLLLFSILTPRNTHQLVGWREAVRVLTLIPHPSCPLPAPTHCPLAVLVTTADHDDRVVPLHSFKYAATLQHTLAGRPEQTRPLFIRIETKAGHGAGPLGGWRSARGVRGARRHSLAIVSWPWRCQSC
jgi:hypothetical protein